MTTDPARARRSRMIVGWALIGAAVVAVAVAVVLFFWGRGRPVRPTYEYATERHVNRQGGYSFWHPPDWEVSDRGTVSEVSNPRGDTSVSFGLGAEGELGQAQTQFVQQIQGSYGRARVFAVQAKNLGPYRALSVAGLGTNAEGVRIRFLAITARAGVGNYSIAVFTAEEADPQQAVPPLQELVNSFRVIPAE